MKYIYSYCTGTQTCQSHRVTVQISHPGRVMQILLYTWLQYLAEMHSSLFGFQALQFVFFGGKTMATAPFAQWLIGSWPHGNHGRFPRTLDPCRVK